MGTRIRRLVSSYFNSFWMPSALFLVLLVGLVIAPPQQLTTLTLPNWALVCIPGAFLGLLCATVWNFIKKRWDKGQINLFMVFMCPLVAAVAIVYLVFLDNFADDLVIPDNIEIAEPGDERNRFSSAIKMREEGPGLRLTNSSQPGIYDAVIWGNPGEPGIVYLKAFEVTKGTPLSYKRLKEKTNKQSGWSEDSDELFFARSHFTIGEGAWGKPYAARFEVWFCPDSGGPERKLMEKVFKIEGWSR